MDTSAGRAMSYKDVGFSSSHCIVAAPVVVFRLFYGSSPDRVQNDISADFKEVAAFLDKYGPVSSLKYMADPVMSFVEGLGIDTVESSHPS